MVTAFVDTHVVDVTVGVRVNVEEYEVPAPRRALALPAEMQELVFCRPRDRLAVVAVYVAGESTTVETCAG